MHIFIMILLISLLIIVHELGHFMAAKIFGIKVIRFGIGLPIGPTLYKHQFKETEFIIHAFLFGGYVAFIDDEPEGEFEENNDKMPSDSHLRFDNKKPWQRAIVLVAGVTMNFVFAVLLIIFAAICYHKLPTGKYEVYIDNIIKENNPSNIVNADIKKGDRVVRINNIDVESVNQFIFVVQNSKFYDGYTSQDIKDKKLEELKKLNGIKGDDFLKKGQVIKLAKSSPENPLEVNSNVAKGWEIFKLDEIKLNEDEIVLRDKLKNQSKFIVPDDNKYTLDTIALATADTYKPISITLLREGKEIVIKDIYPSEEGKLNVLLSTKDVYMPTDNFKNVFVNSWKYAIENTKLMIFGFKQILTGKIAASEMHGIVLIAKVGGDVIKENGLLDGLLLTAIISINLAILNLLPIPALDGGQLLFLIIEKLTGERFNKRKIAIINNVFFIFLLILMGLILFNDIYALIIHKF